MKAIEITVYVFEGDRLLKVYVDHVHDTMFNVATQHVPNMLRAVGGALTLAQDIRQVILEVKE